MEKEINIGDVIKYLSRAFSKAAARAANMIGTKAYRSYDNKTGKFVTTTLYDYQIEYCYLIDNIKRGTRYVSTKSIQKANELIAALEAEGK